MNARTCSAHGAKAIGDRAGIQSPAPKPFFSQKNRCKHEQSFFGPSCLAPGGRGGSWDFLLEKSALKRKDEGGTEGEGDFA